MSWKRWGPDREARFLRTCAFDFIEKPLQKTGKPAESREHKRSVAIDRIPYRTYSDPCPVEFMALYL